MQSRLLNEEEINFCKRIAEKTAENLQECRFKHAGYRYALISSILQKKIADEIFLILSAVFSDLTETQLFVFKSSHHLQRLHLINKIAGTIKATLPCSILTGENFSRSGLCELYFQELSCKQIKLGWDMMIQSVAMLTQKRIRNETCWVEIATENYLTGSLPERRKYIITIFCSELAKLAKEKELCKLLEEKNAPQNKLIQEIQSGQEWLKKFGFNKNSEHLDFYFQTLSDCFLDFYPCWNLISPALFQPFRIFLPEEISKHIITFFKNNETKQLTDNLSLVNKAAAEIFSQTKNEMRKFAIK